MVDLLSKIKITKQQEVTEAKNRVEPVRVREQALAMPPPRGFARAVRGNRSAEAERRPRVRLQVIAEVKKASPSVGVIREDFDAVQIARSYEAGGASAISCLTDETYFQGSIEYLSRIREAVELPILRKDFMLDTYQVWESRAAGADAILLIAGFISWADMHRLRQTAREAGLDVLLEIHSLDELEPALEIEPDVIGINNRKLRSNTFVTDLDVTMKLAPLVPPKLTLISESGIRDRRDVRKLAALGVDGILVGEHLMREPNPGAAIAQRLGIHSLTKLS